MAFDPTLYAIAHGSGAPDQQTVADKVAADLHGAILRGEFPGGSQLKVQDLADRYGASAMPIREALRRLTALGLVQILPHRGARVLELSLEDMRDTMSVRLALEPLAAELAAAKLTSEDVATAATALARLEADIAAKDRASARRHHRTFHMTLYQAAGSAWLLRLIEPLWQNADRYRFAYPLSDADQIDSNHEHRLILGACIAGDVAGARLTMREHLELSAARVEALLLEALHETPESGEATPE